MNKELEAAFAALNARLLAIETSIVALGSKCATQDQVEEVRRVANDTLAAAINAQ